MNSMNKQLVNPFSDKKYITTDNTLREALSHCLKCSKITQNGKLIIPSTDLPSIILPKLVNNENKFFLVVNIKAEETGLIPGHWIGLSAYLGKGRVRGRCIAIDAANRLYKYGDTVSLIQRFCFNNKLNFISYSCTFESPRSFICGQLILFMCYKTSLLSFNGMMNLKNIIKYHTIPFNERYMLTQTIKHFKLKI